MRHETLGCCQRDLARLVEAFDELLDRHDELERQLMVELVKVERLVEGLEGVEQQVRYARAVLEGRG